MKTIPKMLTSNYGNMSKVSRLLDVSRDTTRKYANDINGKYHRVIEVEGVEELFTRTVNGMVKNN